MARAKITAYVTPDTAESLKRLAAIDDRSMSDIIEDAVAHRLMGAGRETEHAALMAKLDDIARLLRGLKAGQDAQFELTAQATRFAMTIAPDIPERERAQLTTRGGERFRNVLSIVVARLSSGQGAARDVLHSIAHARSKASTLREAAE